MNFWSNYPFSRLLLPFLLGLILEIYFPTWQFQHLFVSILLLGIYLLFYLFKLSKHYSLKWVDGLMITLLFFSFGHNYVGAFSDVNKTEYYGKHLNSYKTTVLVSIREPVVEKAKSFQLKVDVLQLFDNDTLKNVSGKALIYAKKDGLSNELSYGDTLLVHAHFAEIKPPKNPGQFNYKRYLRFHQMHHQLYITENDWQLYGKNTSFSMLSFANGLRKEMLSILQQNHLEEDEFAVASALILGFRESLGDDLKLAYSSAGAMHVLAVSGLHVGIIYMVMSVLLGVFDKKKSLKYVKALLLLGVIWFYAFITGLSPSVLRASTMFSFIIIGTAINRNTNIYNTLFASAFFLLLYNPYLIMQVGFQLSYLAVIGIVYMQPKIYNLWYTRFWLLDKIWAITSVSIAAQIATFPIGLLYFHQFPNYFMLSNLVVIPAATIILALGILVLATSFIPVLSGFLGLVLNYAIKLLNWCVMSIEQLPHSLTTGISISVLESWLIYAFIILFWAFLHYKKAKLMLFGLVSLAAVLSFDLQEDRRLKNTQGVVFYSINKATAVDFIVGNRHYFLSDSATFNDHSTMLFNVKHHWDDLDLEPPIFIDVNTDKFQDDYFYKNGHFIQFLDKRLLLMNDTLPLKTVKEKIELDAVLLTNNATVKIQDLTAQFEFHHLLFDASNSYKNIKTWQYFAKKDSVSYYNLSKEGAFVLE